jgi:ribonucleoside-diphosphate reductase alpha chain
VATQAAHVFNQHIEIDRSRDERLTPFGRATLADRYLLPGEGPQDLFARVARAYADDLPHAQRLYDYMSRLWFMPATACRSRAS